MVQQEVQTLPGPGTQPQFDHQTVAVKVSPAVAAEVKSMADDLHISMPRLFAYAFGVVKIALTEAKNRRKLMITAEDGTPVREILLPNVEGIEPLRRAAGK